MSNLFHQIAAASSQPLAIPTNTNPLQQNLTSASLPSIQTQPNAASLIEQFLSNTASSSNFGVAQLNQPPAQLSIPTTTAEACLSGENLQMLATLAALRVENTHKQQFLGGFNPNLLSGAPSASSNPLAMPLGTPQLQSAPTQASTLESLLLLLTATQQQQHQEAQLLSPTNSLLSASQSLSNAQVLTTSTPMTKPTIITTVVPPTQKQPQVVKRGRPRRSLDTTLTFATSTVTSHPKPQKLELKPQAESSSKAFSRPVMPAGRMPTSADSCSAIANYLMTFNKVKFLQNYYTNLMMFFRVPILSSLAKLLRV